MTAGVWGKTDLITTKFNLVLPGYISTKFAHNAHLPGR